jgi:HSP20 family molecular chaperone IbpA
MEVPVKKQESSEIEHASDRAQYVPEVDIYESENGVVVLADLPGAVKESVNITVDQGVLSIHARSGVELPPCSELRYAETGFGDFSRQFRLGADVDRDKMEASLVDGVLKLFIPKSDWAKTRKIEVK